MKMPLRVLLIKAYRAQQSVVRPYMSDIGLSPGQPMILHYLTLNNHCMQKDLAAACEIEPASVSKILNNMETQDLIKRSTVAGNKRAASISITDKGFRLSEQIQSKLSELEEEALYGFTEAEQEQFADYLKRMYKNITNKDLE